jgi:hypothetical protein
MTVMLDITPQQLETISRHAWMVQKYNWYAFNETEIHESGESQGGIVAQFEQPEQVELVLALCGIAQSLTR